MVAVELAAVLWPPWGWGQPCCHQSVTLGGDRVPMHRDARLVPITQPQPLSGLWLLFGEGAEAPWG